MQIYIRCITLVFLVFLFLIPAQRTAHAQSFENYSPIGGEVSRHPFEKKNKSCSKLFTCGPTMSVTLTMHSSDADLSNYNLGENGSFEQMMERAQDYTKLGGAELAKQIEKSRAAHEAPKITIVFPMIDYGFSGTFDNILISENSSGSRLKSVKKNEFTEAHAGFTGTVTVIKYSPYVLQGSYTASLFEYDTTDAPYRGPLSPSQEPQIKLVTTGSINGEFNILSPWRGDERMNDGSESPIAIIDPMKDDIKRLAAKYGIDVDVDKEFDKVDTNTNQNSNNSSERIDPYDGCDCSCNYTESATPICQKNCLEAFDVCKGERYTAPEQKTPIERTELPSELQEAAKKFTLPEGETFMNLDQETIDRFEADEVKSPDNLRSKFIALLEQQQPGEKYAPTRAMMLQGFDSMPDEESKMVMFISLGGKE